MQARQIMPHLTTWLVVLVACFGAMEVTAAGTSKSKDADDQILIDAAEQLRIRDLSSARATLHPLCPGDLHDAAQAGKKGSIPCRLVIIAETETRGTRTPDKISLLYWNVADDASKGERFALARSLLNVAIDRYPEDPENWYSLGLVERDLGRFAESRQALGRVVELKPGHRDALYWTATDLMDEGKYDESTEILDRLLASDPKDCRSWYRRGQVRVSQGRCAEAAADLEKARALGVDPKKIKQQLKECAPK
jgi:tetratricopeptide (TPR) repeat protein